MFHYYITLCNSIVQMASLQATTIIAYIKWTTLNFVFLNTKVISMFLQCKEKKVQIFAKQKKNMEVKVKHFSEKWIGLKSRYLKNLITYGLFFCFNVCISFCSCQHVSVRRGNRSCSRGNYTARSWTTSSPSPSPLAPWTSSTPRTDLTFTFWR